MSDDEGSVVNRRPRRGRRRHSPEHKRLLTELSRRLYIARLAVYRTASEAAREMGKSGPTYLAHENGTRGIRTQVAEFYARKLGVSTDWLLFGRGTMEREAAGDAQRSNEPYVAGETGVQEVASSPLSLDWIRSTGGLIFEIGAIHPQIAEARHCVTINNERFAITGVQRVPLDMLDRSMRLVAVRIPRNDLLADMPGGQRAFVDPDDRLVDDEGLFIIVRNHHCVPAKLAPAGAGYLKVRFSTSLPPLKLREQDVYIVGRMVMKLCEVTDAYIAHLLSEMRKIAA